MVSFLGKIGLFHFIQNIDNDTMRNIIKHMRGSTGVAQGFERPKVNLRMKSLIYS